MPQTKEHKNFPCLSVYGRLTTLVLSGLVNDIHYGALSSMPGGAIGRNQDLEDNFSEVIVISGTGGKTVERQGDKGV